MIGVVNYLDILHHLVSLYPDRLFNYNYSIRELASAPTRPSGRFPRTLRCTRVISSLFVHLVLQLMETQSIASVPVTGADGGFLPSLSL